MQLSRTVKSSPTLQNAIDLATEAHRYQKNFKSDEPYIEHPLRVMEMVEGEYAKMTAVLHDVLEDTRVSLRKLVDLGYPAEVIGALELVTKRPKENYADFIIRIVESNNPLAIEIKLADLSDNMDLTRLKTVFKEDFPRWEKYFIARAVLLRRLEKIERTKGCK